jgi:hypothetical protein
MLKMKKKYFLSLFLFFHGYFCPAQQPPAESDANRVEVVKMAYITRELNLTPEEAQNFWPVYNNYENEIKQARNQYPSDEVAFEKKVVEIKERYQKNFKKVLGSNNQRLNKVYTTDKQFNNMLRNEQKNRQQNRKQTQEPQQQLQNQVPKNKSNNSNKVNNPNKKNKQGSGGNK